MKFEYTDDIEFPTFIVNVETKKICFRNKFMEEIIFNSNLESKECLLQIEYIKKIALERLSNNDMVIFSYNALLEGISYDLKVKSHYIEPKRKHIIIILYSKNQKLSLDSMDIRKTEYIVQQNDLSIRRKINRLLLSYTHDLIWLIFAKTDSYMIIEHMETTRKIPTKINHNYESFINNAIEEYCKKEDWEYLKLCFSVKNLKKELDTDEIYDFVGQGTNLEGTPIKKLHQFTYFDREKEIILYSRRDITNIFEQISFKINGITYNLRYNEILFIESFGRKCEITTINEILTVNENISSIQNRLSGNRFIRCHRSYIINLKSIIRLEKNYAILSNEKSVPINRQTLGVIKNM